MRFRNFGSTTLRVSEIGFGAWAIGGGAMVGNTAIGWGDADDAVSVQAIHAALDAGINFFDTADIYGLGHSELLLGKALQGQTDVVIATKVGNVARNNQFTVDYTASHIMSACDASLRRLNRETIDYYQLHTARLQHLEDGQCIEAMQLLQQQGKIKYWGISLNTFEPMNEARFLAQQRLGSGFQVVFNIINQLALPVLQLAAAAGYGIIARMPLQFGLLTGKFDHKSEFSANDHRKNRLTREIIEATLKVTDPVWQLCNKYNCSKTELALSFILSYPEVSTIIPGIRTPQQVQLNTGKLFRLEATDRSMIEALGAGDFVNLMEKVRQQG